MKRILGLTIAVALCAGCRSQQPVYDPFLGPTTVPPPGTAAPPPGQPYYGAPPGAAPVTTAPPVSVAPPGAVPTPALPRGGVPLNFAPAPAGGMSSSFTPNVSPQQLQPGAAPMLQPTPAGAPPGYAGSVASLPASAVRPVYGPPGGTGATGYAYPQAAAAPQYGTPTLAQPPNMAQPTAAQSPAASGVTPATHWEPAGQNSTNASGSGGMPVNSNGAGGLPTTTPNQSTPIRIVSPSASATPPINSTAATSGLTSMGASSPTLNQSLNSTPPSTASSTAANSTLAMARIPEIGELPPASGYTPASYTSTVQPVAAQRAAAMATAAPAVANSAAGQPAIPVANYGYDAQYHWLKGKLEYSQSTNTWRLRYIPPDGATDNYGGSVVLSDASKLNGLHPGDLVYAQGTPGAASGSQGSFAPLYNLAQIQKQ